MISWSQSGEAANNRSSSSGVNQRSIRLRTFSLAIFEWIERTFGHTPGAHAGAPNPETMKTAPSAANTEARPHSKRRRKDPVSPSNPEPLWGSSAAGAPGHA